MQPFWLYGEQTDDLDVCQTCNVITLQNKSQTKAHKQLCPPSVWANKALLQYSIFSDYVFSLRKKLQRLKAHYTTEKQQTEMFIPCWLH